MAEHMADWTPPTCAVIGYLSAVALSLIYFNSRPWLTLSDAIQQRWKLCTLNLLVVYLCALLIMKIKAVMPFLNDTWINPENDSLSQFLLAIFILDFCVWFAHKALHNVYTLNKYHSIHDTISSKHLYAFDLFYIHPIDNVIEFIIPYALSIILSNNSKVLTAYFVFLEISSNAFAHQPELNSDHIAHHKQPIKTKTHTSVSFALGLFMDPMMKTSSFSIDSQLTHIISLPLVYYTIKLQFPPLIYLILFTLSVTYNYISRNTRIITSIKRFNVEEKVWKLWYNYFSNILNKNKSVTLNLMNWGFYNDIANENYLNNDKESFRKMLYEQVLFLADDDFKDKRILEVGCGRGGGMRHLLDTKKVNNIIGVDISTSNIKNCNDILSDYLKTDLVEVMVGNAMNLKQSVKQNYFDVVINIESSHCYRDFGLFVDEVYNVLKLNGHFCFCDFRENDKWIDVEKVFRNSGKWRIIKASNITKSILKASDVTSDYHVMEINKHVPALLRNIFKSFANTKDSSLHKRFENGALTYKAFCVQKTK